MIKRYPRWGRLTNLPSCRKVRLLPNGLSNTVQAFRSEWAPDFTVVAAASELAKQLERRRRANISDSRLAVMANWPGGNESAINPAVLAMKSQRGVPFVILGVCIGSAATQIGSNAAETVATVRQAADGWRRQYRITDLHQHIDCTPEHLLRAAQIMDRVGIGIAVNLSGGTTTHQGDAPSEFGRNKQLADRLFPGRFIHYMNLDYTGWDQPDFAERAVRQIEEGNRLGAAGFKEFKRLGLYLRDGAGRVIKIDDPKLDPVWKRCGELGMPVSIHVADPKAFWLPYDQANERWKELKDHRNWWFGDTHQYPAHEQLLAALNRVIGRHDAEKVRRLFIKYQDRILFATDFQVYNRLTLGSGGSGPTPTDDDAAVFFQKHWRWLETDDRQFEHMTPIQGDWRIDAIGLPAAVLRKIYFDNARRLLVRSMPLPVLKAKRINRDFKLDGKLGNPLWRKAQAVPIECTLKDGRAIPEISTTARCVWSDH